MSPADNEILCAAQSDRADKEILAAFERQFRGLLRYFSARACSLYKLDQSECDAVMSATFVALLQVDVVRFDPERGDAGKYLQGFVLNAARSHARFLKKGLNLRHNWSDPINVRLHLPSSIEEVGAEILKEPALEVSDLIDQVLLLAEPGERVLIDRHFFAHEPIDSIARSMGVARTTVRRRLNRFYSRVFAQLAA
jgi:DNA-directed RNA polymerase specialized sigma24 family protein